MHPKIVLSLWPFFNITFFFLTHDRWISTLSTCSRRCGTPLNPCWQEVIAPCWEWILLWWRQASRRWSGCWPIWPWHKHLQGHLCPLLFLNYQYGTFVSHFVVWGHKGHGYPHMSLGVGRAVDPSWWGRSMSWPAWVSGSMCLRQLWGWTSPFRVPQIFTLLNRGARTCVLPYSLLGPMSFHLI